jgi:hypothetical protein
MTVNLPLLLFGLLVLWFPRQWMRFGLRIGRRRKRSIARWPGEPWTQRESGDPKVGFREFGKVRNYFDLLRAAAGGLAIIGGLKIPASISTAGSLAPIPSWQLLAFKLGIIVFGLLIQTVRYERRHLAFYAPIFYLAGLSISLCSAWSALFAFVLVWAINPMMRDAHAFLFVYGVALAGFGLLFRDVRWMLPVAAFLLCFLPVLLSLLTRRPLVVFTRKATHAPGAEA